MLDQMVRDAETGLREALGERGAVVFLAPMGARHAIAVEAWQAVGQWDLQLGVDGALLAIRYGLDESEAEYRQTLANLRSRITTAEASDSHSGQRIANVSGLTQHYRDMGAYGDITPDDGDSSAFTPAQPLDIQTCAAFTAMGSSGSLGLTRDCSALIAMEDTLAGTASLNWSKDTAINSWTGVTLSGTPQRVTGLALPSSNLNGTIPAGPGRLHGLTSLDLSGNALTGSIPAVLGDLPGLATLRLSGNSLSGCIPVALRDLETNDLATLGISFCDMLTPPTWDAVEDASKYEAQHRPSETEGRTALPENGETSATYSPEGGPACGLWPRWASRASASKPAGERITSSRSYSARTRLPWPIARKSCSRSLSCEPSL